MHLEPWMPEDNGRCGRGCCWTPYGCATSLHCECHPVTYREYLKLIGGQDD